MRRQRRQRHQHRRGGEVRRVELAEREIGNELHRIGDGEEDDAGAGEDLRVEPERQRVDLVGRTADMGDEAGEAGDRAPERRRDRVGRRVLDDARRGGIAGRASGRRRRSRRRRR